MSFPVLPAVDATSAVRIWNVTSSAESFGQLAAKKLSLPGPNVDLFIGSIDHCCSE